MNPANRHPVPNLRSLLRLAAPRLLLLGRTLIMTLGFAGLGSPMAVGAEPSLSPPLVSKSPAETWQTLFDSTSLTGWKVIRYAGAGEVEVVDGSIILGMGAMLTGVAYTNPVPKVDYEVTLKAMKLDGSDFFCGLTIPVQDSHCTLIAGGWGGGVVGISSLDNYDASENETTTFRGFEKNRWYSFRVRVTKARIEVWLDGESLIDVSITGRKISMRPGDIEMSVPFGISAWQTRAALRDIRLRSLDSSEATSAATPRP